ncbi:MAG TPA: cytochrome P460 family protein, partial [Lacipirellulaceae bacterium]|nr:cytochrome P460 family protein [Lacipirellulaceae bacterium]
MPRWVLALCVTAACALGAPGGGVSLGAEPGDGATPAVAAASTASPHGTPSSLPLPSSLSLAEYERLLFDFLDSRQYKRLGWRRDKKVRDTGPYRDGVYYGTHPAVFIYYSPEIIEWLEGGQQHAIPDGAMMIKEQYEPPAARWEGMDEDERFERLSSWTVMVKDSAGSHDGWFWSNPGKGQKLVDYFSYPFEEPYSGCGIYCVRCHASTKTAGATNEYTFASLRNVEGYPEEPLEFEIDDSWRQSEEVEEPGPAVAAAEDVDADHEALLLAALEVGSDGTHPRCAVGAQPTPCNPVLNAAFLELFPSIAPRDRTLVQRLPGVTHDWVVRRPGRPEDQPFVTSNQCMSCHAGLVAPFGPTMFHPTGDTAEYGDPGIHISPYGEWRWTPMGLAGRDPVFFAQLESEVEMMREDFADDPALGAELAAELVDTCLTCHGAMGKHQFDIDHGGTAGRFTMAHVLRPMTGADAAGPDHWKYGALARDGISCAVCHQMEARPQPEGDDRTYLEHFLETSITGNIYLGQTNELHGPLEDKEIAPYTMEHALGYTPKHNPYIRSSQMCGSCHVVNLPIIDRPEEPGHAPSVLVAAEKKECFKGYHHHVEQATYLEWLNSVYENEVDVDNSQVKTYQNYHMARDLHHDEWDVHLDRIETQIAAIQDHTYPHAENLAEREHLEIRRRTEGYARHNFRGLNVFLLEMFRQF